MTLSRFICDISKIYTINPKAFAFGISGSVHDGERNSDHLPVAVKIFIEPHIYHDHNSRKHFIREVNLLASINHPFCLKLVNFSFEPPIIVTPRMFDGTLDDFLSDKNKKCFNPTQKMCAIYAICSTMAALHFFGIIHRDFKAENIFMHKNGNIYDICIADFGSARKIDKNIDLTKSPNGTPKHQAPESFSGEKYTNSVDVYSFGVLFYQCFSYNIVFANGSSPKTPYAFMDLINKGERFARPPNISDEQWSIYLDCTNQNDNDRPSFHELMVQFEKNESIWIEGVDKIEFLQYVERCKKIYQDYIEQHKNDTPITENGSFEITPSQNYSRSMRMKRSRNNLLLNNTVPLSSSEPTSLASRKKAHKNYDIP